MGAGFPSSHFFYLFNQNIMENKLKQSLLSGIAGTIVMTIVMLWVGPIVGLPEMNTAAMLSMMTGFSITIGWIMHFVIGIVFAFTYVYFLSKFLNRIGSSLLRGIAFGFIAFILGQIGLGVMGALFGGMPAMETSMALIMIGSIVGHLVYGIVVVLVAKDLE